MGVEFQSILEIREHPLCNDVPIIWYIIDLRTMYGLGRQPPTQSKAFMLTFDSPKPYLQSPLSVHGGLVLNLHRCQYPWLLNIK